MLTCGCYLIPTIVYLFQLTFAYQLRLHQRLHAAALHLCLISHIKTYKGRCLMIAFNGLSCDGDRLA